MHYIVADLGYGDAGKGSVVDWLCSSRAEPATVVRFNGGAQAGHNVVLADGRHHCFSQFGSGTLQGARTHLSRYMMVEPLALAAEAAHLIELGVADPLSLLTVDRHALLTTPYHQAANQARELARGDGRHGSCGKGIGETAQYAIRGGAPRVSDCSMENSRRLTAKLDLLIRTLENELGPLANVPSVADTCAAYQAFAECVRITGWNFLPRLINANEHSVVFEGAQGVLLDELHGFHPYTTWSKTTFSNAIQLLREAGSPPVTRLGVTRTYMTRHGVGPFVTEDRTLEIPEPHNPPNLWQGKIRLGHLDAVALRYAIRACGGVDQIALTHADTAANQGLMICTAYDMDDAFVTSLGPTGSYRDRTECVMRAVPGGWVMPYEGKWGTMLSEILGKPVGVVSYGPAAGDKRTESGWQA